MPENIAPDLGSISAPKGTDFALDSQNEAYRSNLAFGDLLKEYRKLSDSERAKGNFFELSWKMTLR